MRHLRITTALLLVSAAESMAGGLVPLSDPLGRHALPPGHSVPQDPHPQVDFGDPCDFGSLAIAERNKLYHFVQLDRSPLNWADQLLRVSVGFQEAWSPADYYALFLEGHKGQKGAVAYLATEGVRFGKPFRDDEQLRSENEPEYTLHREADYVVVTKGDERRWYFESIDGGQSWRLAKIAQVKQPNLFTTVRYDDGGKITSVVFPNGREAVITYEGKFPTRITTPFGEAAEIERAGGWIRKIIIRRGVSGPVLESHQYEHDGEGRIVRFIDKYNRAYRIEYTLDHLVEDKTKKDVFTSVIHREIDGAYLLRRHEERESREWIIEDRVGARDQKPTDAYLEQSMRTRLVGRRWSLTARATERPANETTYECDQAGNPMTAIDPSGTTRQLQYDAAGRKTEQRGSDGSRVVAEYNALGQRTRLLDLFGRETRWTYDTDGRLTQVLLPTGAVYSYTYDERGFPASAELGQAVYRFGFDEWGSLRMLQEPSGVVTHWEYDGEARQVVGVTTRNSAEDEQWQLRVERDERRRVVRVAVNEQNEKYFYSPKGQLVLHVEADGNRVRYEYDDLGRLHRRQDPKQRFDEYDYYPSGRIRTHRWRLADGVWNHDQYEEAGRLLSRDTAGTGRFTYEYDQAGRLSRILHPGGGVTRYGYDRHGQLVQVKRPKPPVRQGAKNGKEPS